MENTRVFVSGLPPSCSNDQLRNHFASRFTVTDAHVLPRRRMGFVGFKSNEVANQAVSYFNRTYMKMSKITVDLARPIDYKPTENNHPTRKRDAASNISSDSVLKRKRDEDAKSQDPKLQEYLALTQSSSKTRTWANDDHMAQASAESSLPINQPSQDNFSEEGQPSEAKKARVQDIPASSSTKQTHPISMVGMEDEGEEDKAKETEETGAEAGPVSDADWLRSKTSRLLGLLDEDEQAEFEQHKAEQPVEPRSPSDDESRTAVIENIGSENQADTYMDDAVETQPDHSAEPEQPDANVELIRDSARLFVRNLAYDMTDADLQPLFSPFGKLDEIHVAFDTRTETSKGFAYVQFADADAAIDAYRALDGKHFQGRLMHILPAAAKKTYKIDEYELSKLPLKKQKQIKRKMDASTSTFNWNSLYMNADAVMSSVAERLGVSKADLLDPTSSDAAVKQAHAETHVIQETKAYFASNGVNIDAFQGRERGNTGILVKNFSFGVKSAELRSLFEPYGQILRLLMPPTGTIAIVEFARPDQAQKAFKGLAYRKLGDSILFLEKAPKNLFDGTVAPKALPETRGKTQGFSTSDTFAADEAEDSGLTSTLFVKNLDFSTTNEKFLEVFRPLDGFITGRVKTKPDPKRPGQTLSMGFGFVEFKTKAQAQAALAAMNGYKLDQHELVIRASHKGMDAAEERRREDTAKKIAARRTKIIIKNLPFQATKKDIWSLFGNYGQLRSVRVPKKFDRSARGFGFADFISAREAENAMDALKNTHLLGRRLVLEFASEEAVDPEEEIAKIEKKVGEQVDRVKIQQLTGTGRKKFTVGAQEDEEA
ncbi:Multiple RNA-binding domain-containing protein 1 [Penicillium macrosclerotiorum]|uniref:Multiple RNA-binding domain-containing protein 1 n=1 Tax=Penicillium macrosclerotiorum TaxID=303699 RepID=UPI0025488EC2|nr:Multiple RNA-binding domain-containing protein 1 [Penicillium macrosclerotiorum]KAJ5679149.1 Multiple RNA-binding domain-containing protein 1 [Penicillium macrosclerotiorum]